MCWERLARIWHNKAIQKWQFIWKFKWMRSSTDVESAVSVDVWKVFAMNIEVFQFLFSLQNFISVWISVDYSVVFLIFSSILMLHFWSILLFSYHCWFLCVNMYFKFYIGLNGTHKRFLCFEERMKNRIVSNLSLKHEIKHYFVWLSIIFQYYMFIFITQCQYINQSTVIGNNIPLIVHPKEKKQTCLFSSEL